ncbi:hypothetical protein ATK36_1789 [Amycolatopsis sulphurea]|uniref:Uncharacterized protein n=1 Tax=Amycolatopsis sulphurea TaxID=76022 RepID=A0A2A9F739_9PSEU|nr:hypothetical protein ATK36_1789 [Amycolatopsis sulphurea]
MHKGPWPGSAYWPQAASWPAAQQPRAPRPPSGQWPNERSPSRQFPRRHLARPHRALSPTAPAPTSPNAKRGCSATDLCDRSAPSHPDHPQPTHHRTTPRNRRHQTANPPLSQPNTAPFVHRPPPSDRTGTPQRQRGQHVSPPNGNSRQRLTINPLWTSPSPFFGNDPSNPPTGPIGTCRWVATTRRRRHRRHRRTTGPSFGRTGGSTSSPDRQSGFAADRRNECIAGPPLGNRRGFPAAHPVRSPIIAPATPPATRHRTSEPDSRVAVQRQRPATVTESPRGTAAGHLVACT